MHYQFQIIIFLNVIKYRKNKVLLKSLHFTYRMTLHTTSISDTSVIIVCFSKQYLLTEN